MVPELGQNLSLHKPDQFILKEESPAKTPNAWFVQRYQEQFHQFGSPFLELSDHQTICVSINTDFFAAVLGGRKDLGHHVVYFEPELAWYFKDSDNIYKTTSAEKLMNQYRALMVKCAEEMPVQVHKLNLFHEFRSDKTSKAVVSRAKSILAAGPDFFGVNSPHQRIRGPEMHERLARIFCEQLLERDNTSILTIGQAFKFFNAFAQQKNLPAVKRSDFKWMISDVVRENFGLGLRNDIINDETQKQGCGWKGLRVVEGSFQA